MSPRKVRWSLRSALGATLAGMPAACALAGCLVGDGGSDSSFTGVGDGAATLADDTTGAFEDTTGDEDTTAGDTTGSTDEGADSGFSTGSTGGTTTGGGQPPSGMYAHCTTDPSVCIPLDTCVQLMNPMTMQVVDGFCSITGCANPASQCAPSPGGTSTPTCVSFGGEYVCALDCSGGKTCPGGMQCYNLGGPTICA